MVERFNLVAKNNHLDFEAWFNDRTQCDRSWVVDESKWLFRYRYMKSLMFAGNIIHYPPQRKKLRAIHWKNGSKISKKSFLLCWYDHMRAKQPCIVMVGAFPPPLHGMAVVNKAILDRLRSANASPLVIDVSAKDLDRQFLARLNRLPKVLYALFCLAFLRDLRGAKLYISVSGGLGQIYEIFYALIARMRGMALFMHHHSFSYLNMRSTVTKLLIKAAGSISFHVTLSAQMAKRLRKMYKAPQTISISNAVFCFRNEISFKKSCKNLRTIGFISNISAEKGVFEFFDLMTEIKARNLPLQALLAGPFQNCQIEHTVNMRLAQMREVNYVGPKCGTEKDDFFDHIDVFVFPTRYVNEAEPMIVLEAMSRGVPIIAYGRGCIPEIVGADCGRIVDVNGDFVTEALVQIKAWLCDPNAFEEASRAAARVFFEIYTKNHQRWQELMKNLLYCRFDGSYRKVRGVQCNS